MNSCSWVDDDFQRMRVQHTNTWKGCLKKTIQPKRPFSLFRNENESGLRIVKGLKNAREEIYEIRTPTDSKRSLRGNRFNELKEIRLRSLLRDKERVLDRVRPPVGESELELIRNPQLT